MRKGFVSEGCLYQTAHACSRRSSRWSMMVPGERGRLGYQVDNGAGCARRPNVAAVVSYELASAPVRANGKFGWTGRLIPLTVDALIYASSMVVLDSARRGVRVSALARAGSAPGPQPGGNAAAPSTVALIQ